MASNADMRRLILHAADRLSQDSDQTATLKAINNVGYADRREPLFEQLMSLTAAIALAEQTLRMVAACLGEDEPEVQEPMALRASDGSLVEIGSGASL